MCSHLHCQLRQRRILYLCLVGMENLRMLHGDRHSGDYVSLLSRRPLRLSCPP